MSGRVHTALPTWSPRGIPGAEFGYRCLACPAAALLPASVRAVCSRGTWGSPWLGCACCRLLSSYLYTSHTHPLLLPSLPQTSLGYAMPQCYSMPGSKQMKGGYLSMREVGWRPSWFLTAVKLRMTVEINEFTLVWTWGHQVSEIGLCHLMAQPDKWLCRVVSDVLEPALTVLVECLAAAAFPDCFEC